MYKVRKIVVRKDFSNQLMNVMRQTACLVVNAITVENFVCTSACRASDLMMAPIKPGFGQTDLTSTVGLLLLQRFSVGLAVVSSQYCILI